MTVPKELVSAGCLLAGGLAFALIEARFPREARRDRPHALTDAAFTLMNTFVTPIVSRTLFLALGGLLGGALRPWPGSPLHQLPLWLELPLLLLVYDLAVYVSHRALHAAPVLWAFHKVHHSAGALDWLASIRNHIVDATFGRLVFGVVAVPLGFSLEALTLLGVADTLFGMWAHSNTRGPRGPIRYLIVTPQVHRWHHADAPEAFSKNLAMMFAFYDVAFGTFYCPRDREPTGYGVPGEPALSRLGFAALHWRSFADAARLATAPLARLAQRATARAAASPPDAERT